MLFGIAKGLPDNDPRRLRLLLTADAHRDAGLAAVTGAHYEGATGWDLRGVFRNDGPRRPP